MQDRYLLISYWLADIIQSELVSATTSTATAWAFAVSADFDVDKLGNSDDADTSVQDDAENRG